MAKKVWKDGEEGGTPITAAELNRIEETLDGAAAKIDLDELVAGSVGKGDLQDLEGKLNRRIGEVDEKADGLDQSTQASMSELAQYMQSALVAKSDLEQSIVDIVQKRFGIEPEQ